ncbi:hypothetical protein F4604DRAFT_1881740 [Suillus subluteus]|nr:hypothetical protein F4604DRAFT_1881740 [Suillus subluteus]
MTTHLHHDQGKNEMVMLMVSHGSSLNTGTSFLTAPSEDILRHSSPAPALGVDPEFYGAARPCDASGNFLPPGTPPFPLAEQSPDDWSLFHNRIEFETAEFLYSHAQMSAPNINTLLNLWAVSLLKHGDQPPFADHKDLYKTIDNIPIGGISWQSFKIQYSGEKPDGPDVPPWMNQQFEVWYRDPREVAQNILANPDYVNKFDYCPFCEYSVDKDEHCYQDFMSGDWAWQQADIIAADPDNLGATFVLIILGSDKTTVSVAHQNALCLIGFLAILKKFWNFRRQIFHSSLAKILKMLKDATSKPEVVHFGDGHYRCVIFGLGLYIVDYEEQVLLMSIVRNWCPREALIKENTFGVDMLRCEFGIVGDVVPFTNDFTHADIHQLIAQDILHQIIKGCFKDHLIMWVEKYLHHIHGKRKAEQIMDDIDRHLAIIAPFTGLQCFPQGCGFKQWTRDNSKAYYLPAIEGHVPMDIIRAFRTFLEFCYLVQRNVIMEDTILQIEDALCQFHHYHSIFLQLGIIPTFSLPRQHAMKHYPDLICLFGVLNGLCSSMTENKHIKAVKQPWRQSNKYNALGQMLVTNQRLDKIAALRVDFTKRSMLNSTCLSDALNVKGEIDDGPTEIEAHVQLAQTQRKCAQTVVALAIELSVLHLRELIGTFLFEQLHPHDTRDHAIIPADSFPVYDGKVSVVNLASSRFYAPSDLSGIGGMQREYIQSCLKWRNAHAHYDCVFINSRLELDGMQGLEVYKWVLYECAVVCWFNVIGDAPDKDTGMWVVQPSFDDHSPDISVIHIDTIYRAAHLLPIYSTDPIPHHLKFHHSLDNFRAFYVNKFADHHTFEIVF